MKVSSSAQKPLLGEMCGRRFEERPGRRRKQRDLRPAVAFEPESRRPAGRVKAAILLGLDDQRAPRGGDLGAEAGPGDSAADDDDFPVCHSNRGYEFESRAV